MYMQPKTHEKCEKEERTVFWHKNRDVYSGVGAVLPLVIYRQRAFDVSTY